MGNRDNSSLCWSYTMQRFALGCDRVYSGSLQQDWPSSLTLSVSTREVCCHVTSDLSFTRTTVPGREKKNKLDPSPRGFNMVDKTM